MNCFIGEEPHSLIKLDKTPQLGFCITEYAKLRMYQCYDTLKDEYGEELTLYYTDTDSFIFSMPKGEGDKLYSKFPEYFDKDLIGKMSDEAPGKVIKRFAAIRAKSYYVEFEDGKQIVKNKGSTKNANKDLIYKNFVDCIEKGTVTFLDQHRIISKKGKLYKVTERKKALNNTDDKRFWLGSNTSVPWGYRGTYMQDYLSENDKQIILLNF